MLGFVFDTSASTRTIALVSGGNERRTRTETLTFGRLSAAPFDDPTSRQTRRRFGQEADCESMLLVVSRLSFNLARRTKTAGDAHPRISSDCEGLFAR